MGMYPNHIGNIRDRIRGGFSGSASIPWTPAMIGAIELHEAAAPASILNAAGVQASAGDAVASWGDLSGNGATATQATAANRPTMGAASDASPSGVVPILVRGTAQGLITPANAAKMTGYQIFALVRLKAGIGTSSRWLIANAVSGGSSNYNILQSSSTSVGSIREFDATATLETSSAERIRLFSQAVDGNTPVAKLRMQGQETSVSTVAASYSLAANSQFIIGNSLSLANGALTDLFAFALVPTLLTRANEQRMEGYLAWRAGLQATALDPAHPYASAPPMVPAGTASTLNWLDLTTFAAQSFMGGFAEVQPDSYDGGTTTPATDGTTELWGFPYSLSTSERARFKAALMPGRTRIQYLRLPLGFGYRGYRNIDSASGLAQNIGERFSGQNAALADLVSNVIANGGGFMPEYWSPAPYWKTTSAYAKGRLWAGGSYARTVTLDSIVSSDATQYAATVDAVTSAMVNDLEYIHQNIGPVRGFALGNETLPGADTNYGSWMTSASEYGALLTSIIPKIRNSTILSTYGGVANTVLIHASSDVNMAGFGAASAVFASTTALSTGKTVLQEMWAQSFHGISQNLSTNPDVIRTNLFATLTNAKGKPTFVSEFEFFTTTNTDAARFSLSAGHMLHALNLMGAPVVMPIIHVAKQLGQNTTNSNTLGYGLTQARLPAPYGQDPSTSGDPAPTIGYGAFDFIAPNWNAAQFVLDNIPQGATIYPVNLPPSVTGIAAVAALVSGKMRLLFVNMTSSPVALTVGLGQSRTLSGATYTASAANVSVGGAVAGIALNLSLPAYSAQIWEEG